MQLGKWRLHGALRFLVLVRYAAGGIFNARRPSCGVGLVDGPPQCESREKRQRAAATDQGVGNAVCDVEIRPWRFSILLLKTPLLLSKGGHKN